MKTIRVDFDNIDPEGLTRSYTRLASRPLYVGNMVLAYDSHGSAALASVVRIGANGTVHLILDPASWREELVPA